MAEPSLESTMGVLTQLNKIGFVEFTTDLVKNVYNVIVQASMDQLKAYAELVKDVAKTVAEYQESVGVGDNAEELPTNIKNYIKEVLGLEADESGTNYEYKDPEPANVTDKKRALITNFSGVAIDVDGTSTSIDGLIEIDTGGTTLTVLVADLDKFVKAKLQKGAADTHTMLVTIMKLGLQKIVVTEGFIGTKLTFHVDAQETYSKASTDVDSKSKSFGLSGGISGMKFIGGNLGGGMSQNKLKVTVVNERSSAVANMSADIVGEVRINFRTESFPSVGD
jgi:hypothetical protein